MSRRELQTLVRDTPLAELRAVPMESRVAAVRRLVQATVVRFDSEAALVRLVEAEPRATVRALDAADLFGEVYRAVDDHEGPVRSAKVFAGGALDGQLHQRLLALILGDVVHDATAASQLADLLDRTHGESTYVSRQESALAGIVGDHVERMTPARSRSATNRAAPSQRSSYRAAHPEPPAAKPRAAHARQSSTVGASDGRSDVQRMKSLDVLLIRADGKELATTDQLELMRLVTESPVATVRALAARGVLNHVFSALDDERFTQLVATTAAEARGNTPLVEELAMWFTLGERDLGFVSSAKSDVATTLRALAQGKKPPSYAERLGHGVLKIINAEKR